MSGLGKTALAAISCTCCVALAAQSSKPTFPDANVIVVERFIKAADPELRNTRYRVVITFDAPFGSEWTSVGFVNFLIDNGRTASGHNPSNLEDRFLGGRRGVPVSTTLSSEATRTLSSSPRLRSWRRVTRSGRMPMSWRHCVTVEPSTPIFQTRRVQERDASGEIRAGAGRDQKCPSCVPLVYPEVDGRGPTTPGSLNLKPTVFEANVCATRFLSSRLTVA